MLAITKQTDTGIPATHWQVGEIHTFFSSTIVVLYGYSSLELLQSLVPPIDKKIFDIKAEEDPLKMPSSREYIQDCLNEGLIGIQIGQSIYETYIIAQPGWESAIKL